MAWAPRIPGNHWTDHATVAVGCGQEVCVTLFAPSAHSCGFGWLHVLEGLRRIEAIPPDLAENAARATEAVLERLPRSGFDMAVQNTQLELAAAAEEAKPEKPPEEDEPDEDKRRPGKGG